MMLIVQSTYIGFDVFWEFSQFSGSRCYVEYVVSNATLQENNQGNNPHVLINKIKYVRRVVDILRLWDPLWPYPLFPFHSICATMQKWKSAVKYQQEEKYKEQVKNSLLVQVQDVWFVKVPKWRSALGNLNRLKYESRVLMGLNGTFLPNVQCLHQYGSLNEVVTCSKRQHASV